MRLVLDEDLFTNAVDDVLIVGLFSSASSRKHRVTVDEPHRPAFDRWADTIGPRIADHCRTLIALSEQEEALIPSARSIRVTRTARGHGAQGTLSLVDAESLINRPFYLFTEGPRVDEWFLLAMMSSEERAHFERLQQTRAVEAVHCGGIQEIGPEIRNRTADLALSPWFCYAIFDSDALCPGMPSPAAVRAEQDCRASGVEFHRLNRRMIENYIPAASLKAVAGSQPARRPREEGLRRARSLEALSDNQRRHYNMKSGFAGDVRRVANEPSAVQSAVSDLCADIGDEVKAILNDGFGTSVARLFKDRVSETDLRRDGGWHEMRGAVLRFFELIR